MKVFGHKAWSLLFLAVMVTMSFAGCSQQPKQGQIVLTGEIKGDCGQVLAIIYPIDSFQYSIPLEQENGTFRLELDNVDGFIDMGVALDEEVYGARVNAGDSLHVIFTKREDGKYDVAYQGKTERESRIWTDFYDVYGYLGQYNLKPDPDPNMTEEDAIRFLEQRDSTFRAKYEGQLDAYYDHRATLTYSFLKAVLMEQKAYKEGKENCLDNPEYVKIIEAVDPEDPMAISCGLLGRWIGYKTPAMDENQLVGYSAFLEGEAAGIKSPKARRYIARHLCSNASRQIKELGPENVEAFLDKIAAYLPGIHDFTAPYHKEIEAYRNIQPGREIPDVALQTREGESVQLSSLFGKVLYIDFWATWCVPCCMEIPYMEKLVEHFKGNGKVAFISISTDRDEAAWREKVENDNPAWPQYRMTPEEEKAFSEKINLSFIPRFILLDSKGKFIDSDATRPSDEATIKAIEQSCDKPIIDKLIIDDPIITHYGFPK